MQVTIHVAKLLNQNLFPMLFTPKTFGGSLTVLYIKCIQHFLVKIQCIAYLPLVYIIVSFVLLSP